MEKFAIETVRLSKRYNESVLAYEDLSMQINEGEFCVFVGKSGCGKTSLLRAFAGLNPPTSGELKVDGRSLYGEKKEALVRVAGRVGFVFQEPNLLPWRTVAQNIRLPLEATGTLKEESRVAELAALVGLEEFLDAFPSELSGGMRQRVSLARSLICEPRLILMDEPFGALDAITRENMNELLEKVWQASSATVVLVTHSISEAVLLADRIIVMTPHPGRIKTTYRIDEPRPRGAAWLAKSEAVALSSQIKLDLEG
ncbi:ABC transporter ATP-binding protein [Orrella marina]|uniref:ABC transporter domain-containing protein n=1 Tax=Orrella marina TaxID=2163011 RepID=A0A2R4XMC1_9BURK|nr:ABC transporter ATP-binding protein [Orrella marina]AWB34957.1 hypothetical protein DBV39_15870 [Orrella marina]